MYGLNPLSSPKIRERQYNTSITFFTVPLEISGADALLKPWLCSLTTNWWHQELELVANCFFPTALPSKEQKLTQNIKELKLRLSCSFLKVLNEILYSQSVKERGKAHSVFKSGTIKTLLNYTSKWIYWWVILTKCKYSLIFYSTVRNRSSLNTFGYLYFLLFSIKI